MAMTQGGGADALRQLEQAHARLLLLGQVSEVLTSTLDVDEALRRLARLVVPRLAEWCVVDLFTPPDGVRRVAVAHRDPAAVPSGRFEGDLPPLQRDVAPLARALRRGEPVEIRTVPPLSVAEDPLHREQLALFHTLGASSAVIIPLVARRVVLGAMTLAQVAPASEKTTDVELAGDVARRAALAVDNARRYGQQRSAAEILQRSMLTRLPQSDHLKLAARYLPAGEGADVGGDWYDAFRLPDGATALVIGDVVGHDFEAAARMGELRNLVRGCAVDRQEPPHDILRRVDAAIELLGLDVLATVTLARVEASDGGWVLRWCPAGHLPPLLLTAAGDAQLLAQPEQLLLGITPHPERVDVVHPLPEHATLLLYTDGLVESREAGLEQDLARLRQHAAALADQPIEQLCDQLIASLVGDVARDDVAILAVQIGGGATAGGGDQRQA